MRKLSYLVISLLVILISCSEDSTAPNDTGNDTIEKMRKTVDSLMENTHIPGIVIGIWAPENDISWVYTAGYSNLQDSTPMADNLLFRIGSNTKTMTITVLLQLVDEGLLSLSDKLSKFFPEYPLADSITVEMLCDMTSGYFDYASVLDFFDKLDSDPKKVWTPEELIEKGIQQQMYFSPGQGWHYSNTNTTIIGLIIEQLTQKSLEENIHSRIFDVLGLSNIYFPTSGTDFPTDNFYHGYYMEELTPEPFDYSEYYDISWAWAAGAVISDLYDLKIYVEALIKGGLISDSLQQKRLNCKNQVNSFLTYGLGMMNNNGFRGHNGGIMGYNSFMAHNPEKNCTVIIFINCFLMEIKVDEVYQLLAGTIYPELKW
ncbi:serine hydrolase domain-containing protein [Bacteroidota bacterium]